MTLVAVAALVVLIGGIFWVVAKWADLPLAWRWIIAFVIVVVVAAAIAWILLILPAYWD